MDLFLTQHKVGKVAEQEVYLQKMEEHGYDDKEYFLKMEEKDVLQMCDLCGIKKHVHRQKIIGGWMVENNKIEHSEKKINNSAPELLADELPGIVQQLIIPTTNNALQASFNETVKDIYKTSYHLFGSDNDFKQYVLGQRQMRFDIKEKVSMLVKKADKINNPSNDGNYINVFYFESNSVVAKNIHRARNSIEFLKTEERSISDLIDLIRNRRSRIAAELAPHQVSEIRFFDAMLRTSKESLDELKKRRGVITTKVKAAERVVNEAVADEKEAMRKKKNQAANWRKDKREAEKCRKLQAQKVLTVLGYKGSMENLENLENILEFNVTETMLGELLPKKHSLGLRWLLERDVFSSVPALHDRLNQCLLDLEERKQKQSSDRKRLGNTTTTTTTQKTLFPFQKVGKRSSSSSGGTKQGQKSVLKQSTLHALFNRPKRIKVEEGDVREEEEDLADEVTTGDAMDVDVDVVDLTLVEASGESCSEWIITEKDIQLCKSNETVMKSKPIDILASSLNSDSLYVFPVYFSCERRATAENFPYYKQFVTNKKVGVQQMVLVLLGDGQHYFGYILDRTNNKIIFVDSKYQHQDLEIQSHLEREFLGEYATRHSVYQRDRQNDGYSCGLWLVVTMAFYMAFYRCIVPLSRQV